MSIRKFSAQTLSNRSIRAAETQSANLQGISSNSVPGVTVLYVTDASYNNLDPQPLAVNTSGGYIRLLGGGFVSGCQVYVQGVTATSVSYVSSTEVRATVPALNTSTVTSQIVYVTNPNGATGILVNTFRYSVAPYWNAASTLSNSIFVSLDLSARSDSTVSNYSLVSGTLPSGLSLNTATGFISGFATNYTTETTYTFTVQARDVELQYAAKTFNVTYTITDPYFYSTGLLLNADGSSAPSYLLDRSPNNFTLNTSTYMRSDSFNPFYPDGYCSVYSGGNLAFPSNAGFNFPGAFTVEAWFYWTTALTAGNILGCFGSGTGLIMSTDGTSLRLAYSNIDWNATATIPSRNAWHHIAMTRDAGNTCRFWIDGVNVGTTGTSNYNYGAGLFTVYPTSQAGGSGYISNLRVIKGRAVYTTTFAVSTVPLTATTDTVLLTCMSPSFKDLSSNALVNQQSGVPLATLVNPFNVERPLTTSGSAFFNGTSNYVTASNYNSALTLGAGDFTIEAWILTTVQNAIYGSSVAGTYDGGSNGGWSLTINRATGGPLGIYFIHNNSAVLTYATSIPSGGWTHIAVTRSSGVLRAFIDGAVVTTATYVTADTVVGPLYIGSQGTASAFFSGYISNLRVVKGTAVYVNTFTVSTSTLSVITGTQLLTMQYSGSLDNTAIRDSSPYNTPFTRVGFPTQTRFSPFSAGGWSMYFDGVSALTTPTHANLNIGTNDFTAEAWVFPQAYNASGCQVIGAHAYGSSADWILSIKANAQLNFSIGSAGTGNISSTATVALNTWSHIAVTRASGIMAFFINGVNAGGHAGYATSIPYTLGLGIGSSTNNSTVQLRGYISDVHLTNGTAKYATGTNFTPPTSPITTITNSVFLSLQDNRAIDRSKSGIVTATAGTPKIQVFSPYVTTSTGIVMGSYLLNGTTDYFVTPTANWPSTTFGTSDFTIELWTYANSAPATSWTPIINMGPSSAGQAIRISQNMNAGGLGILVPNAANNADQYAGYGTMPLGQWHHIALVKLGSTSTIYLNGKFLGAQTAAFNYANNGYVYFGQNSYGDGFYNGYISNARIIKGRAVYTGTFTVSTVPLALTTDTTMLMNGLNASIVDVTGRNNVLMVGNTGTIAKSDSPQYGNSSIYFGTSSYMTVPYHPMLDIVGGNYTVESWIKPLAAPLQTAIGAQWSQTSTVYCGWALGTSNSLFRFAHGPASTSSAVLISSQAFSTGTWYHVAVTKAANTFTMYVNGQLSMTTNIASSTATTTPVSISFGNHYNNAGSIGAAGLTDFVGYIDDFRVTKGIVRYTGNFTPPIAGSPTL